MVFSASSLPNFIDLRPKGSALRRLAGVVRLFGAFEDAATVYLVQELCAKGDLFRYKRERGPLPEWQVRQQVRDVSLAL